MSKHARTILTLALLMLAAVYVARNYEAFASLKLQSPAMLLPLAGLILISSLLNALHNRFFFRAFGLKLDWTESLGLSFIATLGNLLTFARGGALSNAVYLKKRHGFSYTRFVVALSSTYVLAFLVNGLAGLIALLALPHGWSPQAQLVGAVFAGSTIFFAAILVWAPRFDVAESHWSAKFLLPLNAWHELRRQPRIVLGSLAIASLNLWVMTGMIVCQLGALGQAVSAREALVTSVFAAYSTFLSVTPGNLGVREAMATISAGVAGIPGAPIIAGSLIERALALAITLVLGLYYSRKLMDRLDTGRA